MMDTWIRVVAISGLLRGRWGHNFVQLDDSKLGSTTASSRLVR